MIVSCLIVLHVCFFSERHNKSVYFRLGADGPHRKYNNDTAPYSTTVNVVMRHTHTTAVALGPPLLLLQLTAVAIIADRRYDHHLLGTSMAWPSPYNPRAVIHSRFQMTRDGRVIVVSPRYRPGIPFTLGSFRTAGSGDRAIVEPDVLPLPSATDAHRIDADCVPTAGTESAPAPLINVIDLCIEAVDDVLWLLDLGVVDTMTGFPRRIAPAKVVRLEFDDDQDHRGPPKVRDRAIPLLLYLHYIILPYSHRNI